MKTSAITLTTFLFPFFLTLQSCQDPGGKMGKGFRLPDGRIEEGKASFVAMNCHLCHTVAGVELPKPTAPPPVSLELGGEVRKVKSYGELVTSIIQPQHVVAPEYLEKIEKAKRDAATSPMPVANDRMTVTQLTDIVTFLHSTYQKSPPPGVNYPYYIP